MIILNNLLHVFLSRISLLSLYLLSISFCLSIFLQIFFLFYPLLSFLDFSPHSSYSSYYLQSHCFVHFSFIHIFHSLPLSFSSIFYPPLSNRFSSMSCSFNVVYLYSPSVCTYFCIPSISSIPYLCYLLHSPSLTSHNYPPCLLHCPLSFSFLSSLLSSFYSYPFSPISLQMSIK